MKIFLSLFFFIVQAMAATAVAQIITDHNVHPEPAPPSLPAAGGTFADTSFNTSLLRVTDANDGSDNHHAYSYWPCMNMNSTALYVLQTNIGPTLYDFDPLTFTISNKRAAFASNCPSGAAPSAEDAIWSDVDPAVMFVHDYNMNLYSYNITTQTYTLVKDMSASFPANAHTGQMNKNHTSDDLFTFTWKDAAWSVAGVFAWRSSTDQFYIYNQTDADECQPDRAGDYLIMKLSGAGQNVVQARIVDLQNNSIADITDGGPSNPATPGLYWAPGHGDMGNGTVLGHDNWNNRFLGRTAANPSAFYTVLDFYNDWSQDYHASHLADDAGWVTLSAYVAGTLTGSGLFRNEIFQVATDGSQNVRRLAHHHSDFVADYNANGSAVAYWSSPKASISKDGNWIVFTSNWGDVSRKDVFILQVPQVSTSVEENKIASAEVKIFPNPSNGSFSVRSDKEIVQLEIFNSFGGRVYFAAPASKLFTVELKNSTSQIYFFRTIDSDGKVCAGKTIVR